MNRLTTESADVLANQMRAGLHVANCEPLNMKTVLLQLNIMTSFRPLSDQLWGLSLKSTDNSCRFILVNSNSTIGSQNFTIAHELFHLYFDDNPEPHFSCQDIKVDSRERSANLFASSLLMPKDGIYQNIPSMEVIDNKVSIDTILRLESLFGVSHSTMVVRLKELKLISQRCVDYLMSLSITSEAEMRGYDGSLYKCGNEGLIIGDYGSMAKRLFDLERISEGHYLELMNLIGYGEGENSIGC